MSVFTWAKPVEVGFDPHKLQKAFDLLHSWAETDKVQGAGLGICRKGKMLDPLVVGRLRREKDSPAIRKDTMFLIASITKPVTVGAAMILVERGLLALEDPVNRFIPKFTGDGRDDVLVRHLMTHTSGLPDMVASNEELRRGHQPLAAFIDAICKEPLLFPAGTKVSYQSMGIALLGEIIQQLAGVALPEFLKKEIFGPLRMYDTSLGWAGKKDRIAAIRLPPEIENNDWNWNSPYWLGFGAPWGGLITTLENFGRYCQMILNNGALDNVRILNPLSVRAMTMNQLALMPKIPEENRRCKPRGLGWRLNWPANPDTFGDYLGQRTFGHAGATGTLCWIDPDTEIVCNLFTTEPQQLESRLMARLSNMICASVAY